MWQCAFSWQAYQVRRCLFRAHTLFWKIWLLHYFSIAPEGSRRSCLPRRGENYYLVAQHSHAKKLIPSFLEFRVPHLGILNIIKVDAWILGLHLGLHSKILHSNNVVSRCSTMLLHSPQDKLCMECVSGHTFRLCIIFRVQKIYLDKRPEPPVQMWCQCRHICLNYKLMHLIVGLHSTWPASLHTT